MRRPATVSAIVSISGTSLCGVMPSTVASAAGTASGSPTPGQLDDPDPVLEFTREFSADLDGQSGLADSADAGQRDQPPAPAPVR